MVIEKRVGGLLSIVALLLGVGLITFMFLSSVEAATVSSVSSGPWSSPSTWSSGAVPGSSDAVIIKSGHTVTYDRSSSRVSGVSIEGGGVLEFDPSRTAVLETDKNIVVRGVLRMRPNNYTVDHTVRFVNVDESKFIGGGMQVLDSDVGLWVVEAGRLDVQGTPKTAWTRLVDSARSGDSAITVENATGWYVGDEVVIAPTEHPDVGSRHYTGFEERIIKSISGNTVTLNAPLSHGHPAVTNPFTGAVYTAEVMNLTRNVHVMGTGDGSASFQPEDNGRAHILIRATVPQTVKYMESRLMGVRGPDDRDPTDGVLGRYAFHFHHNDVNSRGSLVEGVVARQFGNHGFVAHGSDGITFRDTIAYDGWEDGYWWDPPACSWKREGLGCLEDNSNDVLYDHTILAKIKDDPEHRGYTLSGYVFMGGAGNAVRNSVAVGVQGGKNASGFHWPSRVNQVPENVWEFSENNISHNNDNDGVFVWQNDYHNHIVENFVAYRNGKQGIDHGAYKNTYQYIRNWAFENGEGGIRLHASAGSGDYRGDGYGQALEYFYSTEKLEFTKHNLAYAKPVLIKDCEFSGVLVDDRNNPTKADFVNCLKTGTGQSLEPSDFSYGNVVPGMEIRVQRPNGTAYKITHDGSSPTLTSINSFYDSSGSTGDGSGSTAAATLSAQPTTIAEGGNSTLFWSSTNTNSCSIIGGDKNGDGEEDRIISDGPVSGSVSVSPNEPTTYELVCSGSGGSVIESVLVDVDRVQPTVSLSANPNLIAEGQATTLFWSSAYADTCSADKFDTGGQVSGSASVSPSQTTTYTLTCVNQGFSSGDESLTTSQSVTVIVGDASGGGVADIDGNGRVDVVDLGILLSNWGTPATSSADLNGDGRVDVIDLGVLLSNWG